MRLFSGTSGYSYKEWKGTFYPEKLPASEMLRRYAERLPAVEINNTFYRMPKSAMLAKWAEEVPDGFCFVIKASRRITHIARLQDTRELLDFLWGSIEKLGDHLGPVFFQLPKWLRKDVDVLRAFFDAVDARFRVVFEFQHRSWHDEEVYDVLRDAAAAYLVTDDDGGKTLDTLPATVDWGYVRMRRAAYTEADLAAWIERLRGSGWREAFVFFKHEDCSGPDLAMQFQRMFQESPAE